MENTRVNSAGSQIALTTRSQTMEFANLYIAYKGQEAEGSRVETLLGGSTTEVDYTPDQRLVTTLKTGKDPAITDGETSDNPDNSAEPTDTTAPVGGGNPSESETADVGKKGCRSMIALPAILLSILGGALLVRRKEDA